MTKKGKSKVDELRDVLQRKHVGKVHDKLEQEPHAKSKVLRPAEEEISGDEIGEQIRAAEEEAKSHYDKLLRVMAEFENFKKRMNRERDEMLKYSNEQLLEALLPSLDDLDRVLDHIPPDAPEGVLKIAEGVELVRKSLLAALARFDLKEVPALGEDFDPTRHEAIATVESEGHEPGKVVAVHRKGYWLGDRLLRPAMVTVAKEEES